MSNYLTRNVRDSTAPQMAVHDVFLVDPDFKIERPTRYYRQGLNLITHPEITVQEEKADKKEDHNDVTSMRPSTRGGSSIRSKLSRVFHRRHSEERSERDVPSPRPSRVRASSVSSPTSGESMGAELARQITPILDPSTNTNPLLGPDDHNDKNAGDKHKKKAVDVSKHTFYIENSQMRLKLFARNEVCAIDQSRVCVLKD